MDAVTPPVATTGALRAARDELRAALLALTLTKPTRAADAARLHVTGAAALLDTVQAGTGTPLLLAGEVPEGGGVAEGAGQRRLVGGEG